MPAPGNKKAVEVPLAKFGKDHWSTFAYAETCAVDNKGQIDPRRLRGDGAKYPSRIKGGEQPNHSDIDCLNDLEAAGLLTFGRQAKRISNAYVGDDEDGNPEYGDKFSLGYNVSLTKLGVAVAAQLRQHKAAGGQFATFDPTAEAGAIQAAPAKKAKKVKA